MENRYMGPDGELFPSGGPDRTDFATLKTLTKEFSIFQDAWYQAKVNVLNEGGIEALTQDEVDIVRLYETRPKRSVKSFL